MIGKEFLKDLLRDRCNIDSAIKEFDGIEADLSKRLKEGYKGRRISLYAPFMPKAFDDELKRRFRQAGWRMYFLRDMLGGISQAIIS